jgi:hypothetical protein
MPDGIGGGGAGGSTVQMSIDEIAPLESSPRLRSAAVAGGSPMAVGDGEAIIAAPISGVDGVMGQSAGDRAGGSEGVCADSAEPATPARAQSCDVMRDDDGGGGDDGGGRDTEVPPCEAADADSTSGADSRGGGGDSGGGGARMAQSGSSSDDGGSSSAATPAAGRADRMQAPVVKLSIKLIDTYNHINQVYYKKQKEKKTNEWDNKNCDYIVRDGDLIGEGRYRLNKVIGSGSFGQVVKALDTRAHCDVAIKIIKNKPAFHKQAKMEVELLEELNRVDPASIGNRDPNIVSDIDPLCLA